MKALGQWLAWRLGFLLLFVIAYLIIARPLLVTWAPLEILRFADTAAPALVVIGVWIYHQTRPSDIVTLRIVGLVAAAWGLTFIVIEARKFDLHNLSSFTNLSPGTLVGAMLVFALGIRNALRVGINVAGLQKEDHAWRRSERGTHGTADFADRKHLDSLLSSASGIPLGEWGDKREILRWDEVGNMMTVASPGSGKLVSCVGPLLLTYPGNVVCTDPRTENWCVFGMSRRLMGRKVLLLNPMNVPVAGGVSATYNPLEFIREGDNFQDDCLKIADGITIMEAGDKAHFHDSAKFVIAGVIAYVWATKRGRNRSMAAVYEHLYTEPEVFDQWARSMIDKVGWLNDVPRNAGLVWTRIGGEERGSFFSTLNRQVFFLSHPGIKRSMRRSSFSMEDLVTKDLDIFVSLPTGVSDTYLRYYRLISVLAISEILRAPKRPREDVMILLEEAANVGPLDSVLSKRGSGALVAGRGNGIKIWSIWQQLAQLEQTYGREGAQVWLGTVSVLQVFGVGKGDLKGSEDYSKLLGETTATMMAMQRGSSENQRSGNFSVSAREQEQKRMVETADEVRRISKDEQLLYLRDVDFPVKCKRVVYYDRPEWHSRYAVNPYLKPNVVQIGAVSTRLLKGGIRADAA